MRTVLLRWRKNKIHIQSTGKGFLHLTNKLYAAYDMEYRKMRSDQMTNWWIISVPLMVLILGIIADYRLRSLPPSLSVNDSHKFHESFIAERAWHDLHTLTSLGTRPTGSHANEILAVDFIKKQIREIKEASHPNQNISSDVQVVTGGYYQQCNPYLSANIYRNVQNVVVRLAGSGETEISSSKNSALMINCHFDSVPGSPGASDDGASCCVMLEILRVLAQQEKQLRHTIIFLLNGAEETGMQASHGFITQHRWAKDIKAFLNLESVGSNGKEMFFQSSPEHGWFIDMYKRAVPHPNGQTLAEEIFELGIIPSDTDFRIFRDFGHIPGMDFAHTLNGYRYHTKYDHIDYLSPEVLQRTGDNILALAKEIANSDELSNTKAFANGRMVYFDLLGFVFISYSVSTGQIIQIVLPLLSVIMSCLCLYTKGLSWRIVLMEYYVGLRVTILSLFFSLFVCFSIAKLLDLVGKSMSWYSRIHFSFVLYCIPTLIIATILNYIFRLKSSTHACARLNGVNLFWTIVTISMTAMGFRSAYIPMMLVLAFLISNIFIRLTRSRNTRRRRIYIHLTGQVFVVLWACHIYLTTLYVLIPTQGRAESHNNPDKVISVLSCFSTIFIASYLIPFFGLLKNPKLFLITATSLYLATLLSVIFTNIGFPYGNGSTNPTPQRHFIMHTLRKLHDINGSIQYTDSGYWFLAMDRQAKETVQNLVAPEIPIPENANPMAAKLPFSGLPAQYFVHLNTGGLWLPADAPVIHKEVHVNALKPVNIAQNRWEVAVTLEGSYPYTIQIKPIDGVKLLNWNLIDPVPTSCKLSEQQSYFVQVTHGLEAEPHQLKMEFEMKSNHTGSLATVSIVTIHTDFKPTKKFADFLAQVPKWAYPVPSIASVQAFEF